MASQRQRKKRKGDDPYDFDDANQTSSQSGLSASKKPRKGSQAASRLLSVWFRTNMEKLTTVVSCTVFFRVKEG